MRIVEVRDFASEDLKAMFKEEEQVFEKTDSTPDAVRFDCTHPLYQGLEIEISSSDLEFYRNKSSLSDKDDFITIFLTWKICDQYNKPLVLANVLEAFHVKENEAI
ncbi:MAG: hypothetical protein HFJ58_01955 [Clostridia bacterium]|nr:hypothetical protein [Clostridia bacterium]